MRRVAVLLIVVAAFFVVDRAARSLRRGPAPGSPGTLVAEPYPIEPFAARDLEGRDVSPGAWAGKVVVVNFWATWCAPCRREIPAFADLQERYRDQLLIVGVLQDDAPDEFARQFGRNLRMNYPIVKSTADIERRFPPVEVLPMTFVIDRSSRVVAVHGGEVDPSGLEQQIKQLTTRN